MYGALWRALPGPAWAKILVLTVLVVVLVAIAFEWLFPLVAEHMPFNEQTVEQASEVLPSPSQS